MQIKSTRELSQNTDIFPFILIIDYDYIENQVEDE